MDLTRSKYSKKRNEKHVIDLSNLVYGKVPPQAIDLEKAILGAIMLEKSAIDVAAELLKPECFYTDAHQRIYRAITILNSKMQPIDLLTVGEQLNVSGEFEIIGGGYYLEQLTNSVVSSANLETHCKIVKQKFISRQCIQFAGQLITAAYEGADIFQLISDHEFSLSELTSGSMGKTAIAMDAALVQGLQRLEEIKGKSEIITGIPSGFTAIDQITYGWQNSDFIILAARPAVGKTAFALNLARNAAINNERPTPVLFISLEMSLVQLTNRIMASESEVWLEKISRGNMDMHDMKQLYEKGIHKLAKAPIFIDDSAALNVIELRAKARRLKAKQDIGFIIIDYLQLMNGVGGEGNREQEISKISRGLKMLAKELNVPIIALSQLSRAVESRSGEKKMPQLSDLRESGAIEQDADMVMFMYRPEYYGETSNENGESTKGETHIKIAKHRNGVLDTVKLRAELSIQKFHSWDDSFSFQAPKPDPAKRDTWVPYSDKDEF